jgi:hypothetical protein
VSGYRKAPEQEDVDEEFVTVARPSDEVEASLLEQALTEERIPCRVLGTRGAALIGVPRNAVGAMRIEVPASQRDAAEEVVEAMQHAEPLPEDETATPVEADDEGPVPPGERRKIVLAIGAVMIFFGGSHFYARRPWTAGILAITQLSAVLMLRRADFPDRQVAAVAIAALLAVDVVFGVRASVVFNRGIKLSIPRQVVNGVLLAVLVAAVSAYAALRQA